MAFNANADPVWRWQYVQWQQCTKRELFRTSKWQSPQAHNPEPSIRFINRALHRIWVVLEIQRVEGTLLQLFYHTRMLGPSHDVCDRLFAILVHL
jgi:hypothetical protein